MNPFNWIIRKTHEAFAEGMRRFMADLSPDSPPANLEELRTMVAAAPPALPAAEQPAETTAPKQRKRAE